VAWDEIAIQLAARAVQLAGDFLPPPESAPLSAEARVTRAVRAIERSENRDVTLTSLADLAGLSPYHFLRTFERVTGLTPHQFVMRARLRSAATRLRAESAKIVDIALDSGFSDISNFNRAFRAEFGVPPRAFRRA
jgi:AraC-like DNA-binding protein